MSTAGASARRLDVLLVEDSPDDAELVVRELRRGGYEPDHERVDTEAALREALARRRWDLVLSDYSMPGFSAPAAFAAVRETGLDLPFIIVSGTVGEDIAVEMMKTGVHDYMWKGNLNRLVPAVERELAEAGRREELRRSRELLARSERLRALGQMASGVSHDLNNVLITPLTMRLDLLEMALREGHAGRALEDVEAMQRLVARGRDLVRLLRDFSRQSPERVAQQVDLDQAARAAVDIASARIRQEPGRSTEILTALGAPPAVLADPSEIVSAIVNLIVNAIEALAGGGTITVRSGGDARFSWVEVADDGPGMPPEVEARVFEPFFTTKPDGTGLGLAMVYACVRRHRGAVTVKTARGQGACFRLAFPAAKSAG
jgi:signal transduction histidine kinase